MKFQMQVERIKALNQAPQRNSPLKLIALAVNIQWPAQVPVHLLLVLSNLLWAKIQCPATLPNRNLLKSKTRDFLQEKNRVDLQNMVPSTIFRRTVEVLDHRLYHLFKRKSPLNQRARQPVQMTDFCQT